MANPTTPKKRVKAMLKANGFAGSVRICRKTDTGYHIEFDVMTREFNLRYLIGLSRLFRTGDISTRLDSFDERDGTVESTVVIEKATLYAPQQK